MQGPDDDVVIPKGSKKTDWEVELAIVIGKTALYIRGADALSYVAGYCICNDVSEREFQAERGGQWMKGKGCPTFGPLGPWLVTPDEIKDVQNLGDVARGQRQARAERLDEDHDLRRARISSPISRSSCSSIPATSSPPARLPASASA